jgi:3-oxoacyl-[acyl-carrier-protein] synthase III
MWTEQPDKMSSGALAVQILGTGEYVPCMRVESETFDRRWGKSVGWTQRQTGVASRAHAGPGEDVVTMGAAAARDALAAAGIDGRQLDAIVCVGSVPYQAIPCTAAFVQRALGLANSGIAAFDVNATCLGFIAALDLMAQGVATGRYRTVLIVASECVSIGLDEADVSTAALFGDGAGAAVIGRARRGGARLRALHLQTFSEGLELCQIRSGGSAVNPRTQLDEFLKGTVFEMQGRQTYKLAAALLPQFLSTLLDRAGIRAEQVDTWVPHQASGGALAHLQKALELPSERFVSTLQTLGNQVSASLPIAFHRGIVGGRIQPGDTIALVGSGAGVSFGGAVLDF